MYMKYNTGPYRAHYKMLVKRYDGLNHEEVCEPRVRKLCKIIRESGLGVSVFSCEGHADETPPNEGYIMFAARNREAATKLIDVFQAIMSRVIKDFGIGAIGEIETNLACWQSDEDLYPCIVLRSPHPDNPYHADLWWGLATRVAFNELQHHIAVNPEFREVA